MDNVSIAKMGKDAGKSYDYIKRKMVSGAYDKDDSHKI